MNNDNHYSVITWQDKVLLMDCTGVWINDALLESVKMEHPNCEDYLCLKMDYVTSSESDCISRNDFCLVSSGRISIALEPLIDRYPRIKEYFEYIQKEFLERINGLHEAIFNKHDFSVLETNEGKEYLLKTLADNLYERSIAFDWNETSSKAVLEICRIVKEILINPEC